MKAAIRKKYCKPEQIRIENIEIPTPKSDEALVKIHSTTVNRTDCANLTARPLIMRLVLGLFKPKKAILGTDFAGEIVAIGDKLASFEVGDRVLGFTDTGSQSQAEYSVVHHDDLFKIPNNIDYNHAAAALEGAHYAYTFIHKVDIKKGQSVLINGATGGIGSALIQFTRQFDVKITATSNAKNIELVKQLGADKVYDYETEDFTADTDQYDFIFDAVGKSTYGKCKPLLKDKGIYISSELGPNAQNVFYALLAPLMNKKVIFPVPYNKKRSIPYISNLLTAWKFVPVIDREYSLDEISAAYTYVASGVKTGNVVIKINE